MLARLLALSSWYWRTIQSSCNGQLRTLHFIRVHISHLLLMLQWMNLCIDVSSLVMELFKGQSFKTLDSLVIGGTFSLRRIFTTKFCPPAMGNSSQHGVAEPIPKCCQFPTSVPVVTKVCVCMRCTHVPVWT